MRKITFLAFLISPLLASAQIDFGSPSATARGGSVTSSAKDWEAIEINPANLGYSSNKKFTLTILNVGINLQDNQLTLNEIKNATYDSLTPANRQQMYNATTTPGGFNLNTNITWFALSFHIPKIGGLAISLTDKEYSHAFLATPFANVVDSGLQSAELGGGTTKYLGNSSYLNQLVQRFNGSVAGGYYYRELNIDYGRKLFAINIPSAIKGGASFENSEYLDYSKKNSDTIKNYLTFYGGIGFKPVFGLADMNSSITNGILTTNATYVSEVKTPKSLYSPLGDIFHSVGRGYGVDIGLSATYRNWKFGASAIDLGVINWQNNQIVSINIPDAMNNIISDSSYGLINKESIFKYLVQSGDGPNYTTQLPSKFRTGLSYQLTKGILLASDFVAPLNTVEGNIINPYVSLSTQINVFNYFDLGVGIATEKQFGYVVPAGVVLDFIGGSELFVGSNDVLAFIGNRDDHVISLNVGIRLIGF